MKLASDFDVFIKQNREFLKAIREFIAKSCKVLYWHDYRAPPPKLLRGGSCVVLRLPTRLVGVTADHVVQAYRKEKGQVPTMVCQLWNIAFQLEDRIIDQDAALDIATFEISEGELSKIGGHEIDCRSSWPPPVPEVGTIISIVGFPELRRLAHTNHSADFRSYIGMTVVDAISNREILTTYDPNRDHDLSGSAGLPPLGQNLSGCSGGPVLAYSVRHGVLRWSMAGLIVGGPRDSEG